MKRGMVQLCAMFGVCCELMSAEAQCVQEWIPQGHFGAVHNESRPSVDWDPDGDGPMQPFLVSAGMVPGQYLINGVSTLKNGVGIFDGREWRSVGGPFVVTTKIRALAVFRGELIAAGAFTKAGGNPSASIARWDGQQWQPLSTGIDGEVWTLCVYNNQLIAGGEFTTAGGVAVKNIASWDGTAWHKLKNTGIVYALGVVGGDLYAGGLLNSAGYIVRWTGSAWETPGGGVDGLVASIAEHEGNLVVSGAFTHAGGVPASGIAAWSGAEWKAIDSGASGFAGSLQVVGGTLYASGNFVFSTGASSSIARWNKTTWAPVATETPLRVEQLGTHRGTLIASGSYDELGSNSYRTPFYQWRGYLWRALGTGFDADVLCSVRFGVDAVVGGKFRTINGGQFNGTARWDGYQWRPMGPGLKGQVHTLAVLNGGLYAGGSFDYSGSTKVNNVARWDGASWVPMGSGLPGTVRALSVFQGRIIAGGYFSTGGGLAQWTGTSWLPYAGGLSADGQSTHVKSLAVHQNTLIVTGYFTKAGGTATGRPARWDGGGWSKISEGLQGSSDVLFVHDSVLYSGGQLLTNETGSVVQKWNGSSWEPVGDLRDGSITCLAWYGDSLIAGGSYLRVGTQELSSVVFEGIEWKPSEFAIDGTVYSILGSENELIIGGYFDNVNGAASSFLIRKACRRCAGDVDGNQFINGDDFDLFMTGYVAGSDIADVNADGFVNGDDFELFAASFEAGC